MAKNFGSAVGAPRASQSTRDPRTSEGLVDISRTSGWVAAMAASAEATIRDGRKREVVLVDNGSEAYVRNAEPQPRDPRTQKQVDADRAVKRRLNPFNTETP